MYNGMATLHTEVGGAGYYVTVASQIDGKQVEIVYFHMQKERRVSGGGKSRLYYLYIEFWNGGIFFRFEDTGDTGNNYGIVLIGIHKNTWNITVKGTTLTIGDPIDKLGGQVKTLTNDDGTKSVFFDCETCDAESWHIDFDSKDRVEEISYTVYD